MTQEATRQHMAAWQAGDETHPGEDADDTLDRLLADLAAEVARQDRIHPVGYPATRDGIRFGLATAEDELGEARDAWRAERCKCGVPLCSCSTWPETRKELLQAAAVILRTIRSIDGHEPAPPSTP